MTCLGYVAGLVLLLFCFVKVSSSSIHSLFIPLAQQYAAESYANTEGQILHSGINSLTNSSGKIKYRLNIGYKYQVNGQVYQASRFRYFDEFLYFENSKPIEVIIAAYPTNSNVRVLYNPRDPADALLSSGIIGDDVRAFTKLIFLYYVELLLGGLCLVKLRRLLARPVAGGVEVIYGDSFVSARLPWFSPAVIAVIAGIFSLFCLSSFLNSNQEHVSFIAAIAELLFNLAVVVLVYFWMRQKICSGIYNLDICKESDKITLPKRFGCKDRLTLKISEISAVTVEVGVSRGKTTSYSYSPALRLHGKDTKLIKLVNWNEQNRAEDFAAWLRKQLGLSG